MNPILQSTLLALVYGALLFGLIKLFGVKYTEITTTTQTLKKGLFLPIGIAGTALVGFAVYTGQLLPAFTPPTASYEWWMWVVPAAIVLGVLARLRTAKWHQFAPAGLFYLIFGAIFVGISEELLARGLMVHLLGQDALPSYAIMLVSSVLFGLMHGMNYFNGQDRRTTTSQIIITTLVGMALYVSLIVSGTLWVPIILHILFDISLLSQRTDTTGGVRRASTLEFLSSVLFYAGTIMIFITFFVEELLK